MNIIKSLNLNKSPQAVPSGSLIFAKNIKVSPDGSYLTNEEGFNLAYDRNIVGKIVGFIACTNEIVIFTDEDKIYRLQEQDDNEPLKTVEVQTAWKWSGGAIKGDYTYNVKGHLIVAIAEYKDDTVQIPLRSIDLDESKSSDNINKYNNAPSIPIANLSLIKKIPGKAIPNGIYYFFIRYEIDKDYYTNWFPIGIPQYALAIENKVLISHKYDIKGKSYYANTDVVAPYNKPNKDCPYNFRFKFDIKNNHDYKNIQIGYILQHDNETIARIWRTIAIDSTQSDYNTEFVFDASNPKEGVIDDFVENVTSLTNVKTVANYENRLYIANYNEVDYNADLRKYVSQIEARAVYTPIGQKIGSSTNATVTHYDVKLNYNGFTCNLEVSNINNLVKVTDSPEILDWLVKATPIDGNEYTVEQLKTGNYAFYYVTDYNYKHVKLKDAYILLNPSGFDIGLGINTLQLCYYDNGKLINFNERTATINPNFKINIGIYYYTASDESDAVLDFRAKGTILPNVTFVEFNKSYSEYTTDIIIDDAERTLMPYNVYNFFIHFVKEDGTYTNGYKISNEIAKTIKPSNLSISGNITDTVGSLSTLKCNGIDYSNLSYIPDIADKLAYEITSNASTSTAGVLGYYENYNKDSLFKTSYKDGYKLGVGFRNITIPPGYIGFFFSYEKPENLNTYQAICERSGLSYNRALYRASDVETAAVNYLGSVYIPNRGDNALYITHNEIVTSNSVTNVNKNILNTIGSNGGIVFILNSNVNTAVDPNNGEVGNIINFNRNIYCNEDKVLIPFGPVAYGQSGVSYSYAETDDTSFANNLVAGWEFNYPSFWCTDKNLKYERNIYIADTGKVYDINTSTNVTDLDYTSTVSAYAIVSINKKYSNINLNALSIKKEPAYLIGVLGDVSSKETKHEKSTNVVVEPLNATDLIEYKDIYKESYPKVYTGFREDIKYDINKTSILRRSDVIQDESTYNAWRHFRSNNYKVLNRNKGAITNLFGVGNYFYIHTENTILVMDKTNIIKTTSVNAKLAIQDLFEVEANEVLVGHHGFGGLQSSKAWHLNHIGYWFVDCDNKKIYCFNDNHIQDYTQPIEAFLKNKTIDDAAIMTDYNNNRVLICIEYHEVGKIKRDYITLSYNYITKSFISMHDYFFTDSIVTKNKCYFHADYDIIQNDIYMFDRNAEIGNYQTANPGTFETLTYNTVNFPAIRTLAADNVHTVNAAMFDVIFNDAYESSKNIDNIRYILNKEYDYSNMGIGRMAEPVMGDGTFADVNHYSGDQLRIYTDSCDSGNLDISQHDVAVNQYNDRKKPFFDKGYWNFNYFRNYLYEDTIKLVLLKKFGVSSYDNLTTEQQQKFNELKKNYTFADNKNLIYGRYFVIRFIFNNEDGVPFRFETLDVKLNNY